MGGTNKNLKQALINWLNKLNNNNFFPKNIKDGIEKIEKMTAEQIQKYFSHFTKEDSKKYLPNNKFLIPSKSISSGGNKKKTRRRKLRRKTRRKRSRKNKRGGLFPVIALPISIFILGGIKLISQLTGPRGWHEFNALQRQNTSNSNQARSN